MWRLCAAGGRSLVTRWADACAFSDKTITSILYTHLSRPQGGVRAAHRIYLLRDAASRALVCLRMQEMCCLLSHVWVEMRNYCSIVACVYSSVQPSQCPMLNGARRSRASARQAGHVRAIHRYRGTGSQAIITFFGIMSSQNAKPPRSFIHFTCYMY